MCVFIYFLIICLTKQFFCHSQLIPLCTVLGVHSWASHMTAAKFHAEDEISPLDSKKQPGVQAHSQNNEPIYKQAKDTVERKI